MSKHKIIDKICKCLRLSESANPNEAAAALRQANRLMHKHRVTADQLLAAGVEEAAVDSGNQYNPPFWAVALSNIVSEAFDCRVLISRRYGKRPEYRFVGVDYAPRIATYCFTVLYRQLEQARQDFVTDLALDDRAESDRRGDVFAQAWLFRVARAVAEFSGQQAAREAVDAYIGEHYGETHEQLYADATQTGQEDYDDILCGMRAAQGVVLFRSMSGQFQPFLPSLKQSA